MNAPSPPPARLATYQDVLDAPANEVAQIVAGRLYSHARPAWRHGTAASGLGVEIGGPFGRGRGGPGGWLIRGEPELHMGDDVLVPDLAGWRRERLVVAAGTDPRWIDVVPDWVCEVLSPSTRRLDLTGKRDAYGREGVAHLWIVDPPTRTLEAFALKGSVWTLAGTLTDDDQVRLPPFDAVEWPLSSLWDD